MTKVGPFDTERELIDNCNRVARNVAREYAAVEFEDLSQELAVTVWRNWNSKVLDLNKWMYSVAHNLAAGMHEREMQCKNVVQYKYTEGVVRKVLEYSFLYQNWEQIPLPDSARSAPRGTRPVYDEETSTDIYKGIPDPTDARDVAADVQIALDLLNESDRIVLIERYKFGIKYPGGSTEAKRLSRAVRRLTDKLNTPRGQGDVDTHQQRRAISNSQANYIVKSAWNG